FVEVVADIKVGVFVTIYIAYGYTKPVSNFYTGNACFFAYIGKVAVVVLHQLMAAQGIAYASYLLYVEFGNIGKAVVQYIAVEVAVEVVIEERNVRGKAGIVKPVGGCLFFKGIVALV